MFDCNCVVNKTCLCYDICDIKNKNKHLISLPVLFCSSFHSEYTLVGFQNAAVVENEVETSKNLN